MNTWLSHALAAAETVHDSLSAKRQYSLQRLKTTPWPTRKTEAWKYTPLRALEKLDLPDVAANPDVNLESIPELATLDFVFVDGHLQSSPLTELPPGLTITALSDAAGTAQLQQLFASVKPERHYFGLVNDVLAKDGLFIDLAANTQIENPIRIVSHLTQGAEAHVRLLVRVGNNAALTIIEQNSGNAPSVNTLFSEYQLADHARLQHYRLALQVQRAISLGGNHFQLDKAANLQTNILAFGSQLSRLDVDVIHNGEDTSAQVNAIYLLDDIELFDLHTNIEHKVPNGTTEENVRGIIGGAGKAVFNGRIHIHPHAQKTNAQLNNRNLLLGNHAEVDTKPELEIYADDVRCAHGATVAQIEERSLYYLQSRGIDRQTAQAMLNFGFINALLEQMPHSAISDWLRPQIHNRFNAVYQRQG